MITWPPMDDTLVVVPGGDGYLHALDKKQVKGSGFLKLIINQTMAVKRFNR